MVGTDSNGNALIATTTGTIQGGDYSRIVLVKDKTTGAVLDTYGQTFTAIKNETGDTTAFRITNKNAAGQDIVIDTVTPSGESLRHEVLNDQGQTYYVRQSGIDIYTTADGSRQAYIAGVDGPIPVGADGRISLSTDKGEISFQISSSPLQGGTCSAGGETYQLKPGDSVSACFGGVMIQGAGTADRASDILLDGTGNGLRFEYEVDPFQFGDSGTGWKLASVDPVLLSGGTMTDVSPGLFSYESDDFSATGNSQAGDFILNVSDTNSTGDIEQRSIIAGDSRGVSQATIDYENGEATNLQITRADGTTGSFEAADGVSVRYELGLYTPEEVADRLDQLGIADGADFLANGFGAAGSQNAVLDDLGISLGGTDYVWSNGFSDLNLTSGGWYDGGNGALSGFDSSFLVNPIATASIGFIGGAMNYVSPLVLDLDGDGVAPDLTHAYSDGKVFFDIDADGFAERVGWVNADDGLLAMDRNGNGTIDDITELYGDDQMPAFGKLRLEDGNADGKIDAQDAAFSKLRVWQDANQDGISQAGELKTLAELDIRSISTNDHSDSRWAKENYISNVATYTRVGGETREIADAHFLNDNINTWQLGAHSHVFGADVKIDLDAIMLPLSRGYGALPSLHLAMSANPTLKQMVRELAYLPIERISEACALVDDQMRPLRTQCKSGVYKMQYPGRATAVNDSAWRAAA